MLSNIIPALILIPLLNWLVPWFITRFDLWSIKRKRFALTSITFLFFVLFILDYPVSLFRDHGFFKHWAGDEIHIFNSAEFFFFLTSGISLFIIFLMLLNAEKTRWFVAFTGMILLAFSLNILAVYSAVKVSLSNYSSSGSLSSAESSPAPLLNIPKISLAFTAKYLVMKFIRRSHELGQQALIEDDLALWRSYHYLENLLYSDNDVSLEIEQASNKQFPDFINSLKHERGYDSDMMEAFKTYNSH